MAEEKKKTTNIKEDTLVADIEKMAKVQEDLMQPLEEELLLKKKGELLMGIKNGFSKFGNFFKRIFYWMINHEKSTFLIFFGVCGILLFVIVYQQIYFTDKYISKKLSDNYTYQEKIDRLKELKISHEKYMNMSSEERLFKWVRAFSGWKYETNGDPKYRKADCVGAVYTYFQLLGSNMILESVPWIIKRVENLSERNLLKIRKGNVDVKSGDLIILKISNENQHVGVVIDVCPTGSVRYADMNVGSGTWGFDWIKFGDSRIKYIAEVSFALWVGDFIQEFNK